MNKAAASSEREETSRRLPSNEIPIDYYRGVELAPKTLESLLTWDVSGHAQRERDRLSSVYRNRKKTQGGY
jgi:hypothetical protein